MANHSTVKQTLSASRNGTSGIHFTLPLNTVIGPPRPLLSAVVSFRLFQKFISAVSGSLLAPFAGGGGENQKNARALSSALAQNHQSHHTLRTQLKAIVRLEA